MKSHHICWNRTTDVDISWKISTSHQQLRLLSKDFDISAGLRHLSIGDRAIQTLLGIRKIAFVELAHGYVHVLCYLKHVKSSSTLGHSEHTTIRASRDYQGLTRPSGSHPTVRVSPNRQGPARLPGRHPTVRQAPNISLNCPCNLHSVGQRQTLSRAVSAQ